MEYLPLIGTVTLLNLVAAISPGPDFVMTVKNAIRYSRRSGIFTGLGVGLGLCVHIIYCAAGIGFIISKSIILFSIIKYLGAAYLIFIGISSLRAKGSRIDVTEEKNNVDLSRLQAFKTGFFTNILNPKATLFFLSLFTFVISHSTPTYVVLIISSIIIATAIIWFSIVSIFLTQQRIRNAYFKFEKPLNRFLGGLLILLGIKVALSFR